MHFFVGIKIKPRDLLETKINNWYNKFARHPDLCYIP